MFYNLFGYGVTMDNYLKISQAAKILGVTPGTLRRWDKTGKFPSQRHPINLPSLQRRSSSIRCKRNGTKIFN